jgi:hypothetical protein
MEHILEAIIQESNMFGVQCAVCGDIIRAYTKEELEKTIEDRGWITDSITNGFICEICKNCDLDKVLNSIIHKSTKPEPWMAIKNILKIGNLYGGYLYGTHFLPNSYNIEFGAYASDANHFVFSIHPVFSEREIKVICVAGEEDKWYIKNATYRHGTDYNIDPHDMCDILYSALKENNIKIKIVNYSIRDSRQLELFK